MSHPYDPKCPDCVPVCVDPVTMQKLPDDHPAIREMMRVWWSMPFKVREAFMAVTKDNSRSVFHITLARQFIDACEELQGEKKAPH